MVYSQKMVATVKCNGKILREQKDVVFLPFGSEYSILLKNLNSKDALVNITVDDKTVIDGLIVRANSEVEVERFVDNSSMKEGYKLKFIEKTDSIREFRGDDISDGIIRIEYWFEQNRPTLLSELIPFKTYPRVNTWETDHSHWSNQRLGSANHQWSYSDNSVNFTANEHITRSVNCCSAPINDEGITVEGNDSYQQFQYGNIRTLESESNVITIKLKGETQDNVKVSKPLEVKDKLQCSYCGKKWKSNIKFCGECGARLTLDS